MTVGRSVPSRRGEAAASKEVSRSAKELGAVVSSKFLRKKAGSAHHSIGGCQKTRVEKCKTFLGRIRSCLTTQGSRKRSASLAIVCPVKQASQCT